MSSLNLSPNPTVMLVQTGIFLANFVAIKKLFLDPYLTLADKRQELTVGNQRDAQVLEQKNEETLRILASKIDQARDEAALTRTQVTTEANSKRDAILSEAELEAKRTIEEMRVQIREELAEERSKLPGIVQELTEAMYQRTVTT